MLGAASHHPDGRPSFRQPRSAPLRSLAASVVVNLPPTPAGLQDSPLSSSCQVTTTLPVVPPRNLTCLKLLTCSPRSLTAPTDKTAQVETRAANALRASSFSNYVVRVVTIVLTPNRVIALSAHSCRSSSPTAGQDRVEIRGLEPLTYALQRRRSPN